MSYSSDPQAIVYHPEISPKQTDTHFKTMISFFSTQAILEGKKLTIKMQSLKTVKSKLEGGLYFSWLHLWLQCQGPKIRLLSTWHPQMSAATQHSSIPWPLFSLGQHHWVPVMFCTLKSVPPTLSSDQFPHLGTPRICPFPTLLPLAHLNTLVTAHQERQGKDTAFHIQALRTRDQINIFCTLWQVKSCADMVWWHR